LRKFLLLALSFSSLPGVLHSAPAPLPKPPRAVGYALDTRPPADPSWPMYADLHRFHNRQFAEDLLEHYRERAGWYSRQASVGGHLHEEHAEAANDYDWLARMADLLKDAWDFSESTVGDDSYRQYMVRLRLEQLREMVGPRNFNDGCIGFPTD